MKAKPVVLSGGNIVDGSGAPGFTGDVMIRDGRITAFDVLGDAQSAGKDSIGFKVINCRGLTVAPGFIDAHSHSDLQILKGRTEKLLQGVTTGVVGNCGFSPYPMPEDPRLLRSIANGILFGGEDWGVGLRGELPSKR